MPETPTNPVQPPTQAWIVCYSDEGNREDCSVFYCWIVVSEDREQAIRYIAERQPLIGMTADETAQRLYAIRSDITYI